MRLSLRNPSLRFGNMTTKATLLLAQLQRSMRRTKRNFLGGPISIRTDTHLDQVPFDNRFCQSLQAGIEEPLYLLVFTLLPNL